MPSTTQTTVPAAGLPPVEMTWDGSLSEAAPGSMGLLGSTSTGRPAVLMLDTADATAFVHALQTMLETTAQAA